MNSTGEEMPTSSWVVGVLGMFQLVWVFLEKPKTCFHCKCQGFSPSAAAFPSNAEGVYSGKQEVNL